MKRALRILRLGILFAALIFSILTVYYQSLERALSRPMFFAYLTILAFCFHMILVNVTTEEKKNERE